jgi:putative membrane protein
MGGLLLRIVINAVAIWLTTLIVSGVRVTPWESGWVATVVTYLIVAVVFALVNSVVGTIIRIVAFPLYILTLGLISFVVNGLLLMLVAAITSLFGFGLTVDGFWWGVLGAIVFAIINGIFNLILRPQKRASRD